MHHPFSHKIYKNSSLKANDSCWYIKWTDGSLSSFSETQFKITRVEHSVINPHEYISKNPARAQEVAQDMNVKKKIPHTQHNCCYYVHALYLLYESRSKDHTTKDPVEEEHPKQWNHWGRLWQHLLQFLEYTECKTSSCNRKGLQLKEK